MSATMTHGTGNSYGKHSRTFWALIYLLVGVLVYGLIYLLFIRKVGGSAGTFNY